MKKAFLAATAIICGFSATGAYAATNLITNGDFESGNTGFSSDYSYILAAGPSALWGEGTYTVGPNPIDYHSLWADFGDHTTGSGKMMIINGSTATFPDGSPKAVWQSTPITLTSGQTYEFTAWVANSCCNASFGASPNALPALTFTTNEGATTRIQNFDFTNANGAAGQWNLISATFTLGATETGQVSLWNSVSAASGNDFALDDISLTDVGSVPEPATWAMAVIGFGAMGATLRRRKQNLTFA